MMYMYINNNWKHTPVWTWQVVDGPKIKEGGGGGLIKKYPLIFLIDKTNNMS